MNKPGPASVDLKVDPATLDFVKGSGLLPAVVQHAASGTVLMVGYMNRAALRKTLDEGVVTFYSRSKQRLWTKGETSGHRLRLVALRADCDRDTLLVQALPSGPVCHLGTATCFGDGGGPAGAIMAELDALIGTRLASGAGYTGQLLAAGPARIAQKVGEEAVETALAAVAGDDKALVAEAADLLYHLLVLLAARRIPLTRVYAELAARRR